MKTEYKFISNGKEPNNMPREVQAQKAVDLEQHLERVKGNNEIIGINAAKLLTKKAKDMHTPMPIIFKQSEKRDA